MKLQLLQVNYITYIGHLHPTYFLKFFFLKELKDESGRLYKLLSERDYEIRKLKKQRDEDRLALGGKYKAQRASDSSNSCIMDKVRLS